MIMKKLNLLITFLSLSFFISSCEEKGDFLTENKNVGGLITPSKNLVGYTIGNGNDFKYENVIKVNQAGDIKVTKVSIFKYFVNTKGTPETTDDVVSNEKLLKTIDIPANSQNVNVPFSVTYNELIKDLTINGSPLSNDDSKLFIGDFFSLRYEQLRSDGITVESPRSATSITKVAVGTRLAGAYKCIEAAYYRIGVLTATASAWPAQTIIESVDATTYKIVGRFGQFPPSATDPNNILFIVNGSAISYSPLQTTGNDQPFITCGSSPANFNPEVNCVTSNKVELDLVGGKDKLYMTFGYLSPSGPRVFYQVLEKIVE
jgi:hypothetical protein